MFGELAPKLRTNSATVGNQRSMIWTSPTLGVGNAVVAQASTTYGTDQASALQSLINAAAGGILVIDGRYSVTTPLSIPSNTTIIFPKGCGIIKQANSPGPIFYNSGLLSGGSISSTARGVGGSTGSTNGTSTPATLSPVGSFPNTNIKVIGGILNCNGQNQSSTYGSTFGFYGGCHFWGVDGLILEDVTVFDPCNYGIWGVNSRNVAITNFYGNCSNKGIGSNPIQFDGPNQFISITNIVTQALDDNLAFNADDGGESLQNGVPFPFPGSITDVHVKGWVLNNTTGSGLRLLSNTQLIDRVIVEGVRGQAGSVLAQLNPYLADGIGVAPQFQTGTFGTGNYGSITLRDWHVNVNTLASSQWSGIPDYLGSFTLAAKSGTWVFDNIRLYGPTVAQPLLWIDSRYGNVSTQEITVSNCEYHETTSGNNAPLVTLNGRCKRLHISRCRSTRAASIAAADSPILKVTGANSYLAADSIDVDDCYTDNVNSMIEIAGGRVGYLRVSGYHHNSSGNYGVTVSSGAVVDNLDSTKLQTDANSGTNWSNAGTITNNITTGGTFAIRSGVPNLWDFLQAYYRFDETSGTTVTDQLATYNLTAHATISHATGKIGSGQCAVFGGSQYYYSADTGGTAQRLLNCGLQGQPYTIAGWVNFSSLSGTQVVVTRGEAAGANNWRCFIFLRRSSTSAPRTMQRISRQARFRRQPGITAP